MTDTASQLARKCATATLNGASFPTVWHSILKAHPAIAGVPIQRLENGRALLEIPLLTGQRIVYDAEGRSYTVVFGKTGNSAI
jgi:hypothetical protein